MASHILKYAFFILIVRPFILIFLGLNVRRKQLLPKKGPALIVANHNSHLDTMVLMSLLPLALLHKVRPVAAGDYFLKTPLLKWFSTRVLNIIPIDRNSRNKETLFSGCHEALREGAIVIFFPEGTRGEPESMAALKKGITYLLAEHPEVPVHPLFLHGLGKALPRGEGLLVPFFCDVFVSPPMAWEGDKDQFIHNLNDTFKALKEEGHFLDWE